MELAGSVAKEKAGGAGADVSVGGAGAAPPLKALVGGAAAKALGAKSDPETAGLEEPNRDPPPTGAALLLNRELVGACEPGLELPRRPPNKDVELVPGATAAAPEEVAAPPNNEDDNPAGLPAPPKREEPPPPPAPAAGVGSVENCVVDDGTGTVGGVLVRLLSCGKLATAGSMLATAGSMLETAGSMLETAGSVLATAGCILATAAGAGGGSTIFMLYC